MITPPQPTNGNNQYYKDPQNNVFEVGSNRHVDLPEFQKLGLNIDHINPLVTAPSQAPVGQSAPAAPVPQIQTQTAPVGQNGAPVAAPQPGQPVVPGQPNPSNQPAPQGQPGQPSPQAPSGYTGPSIVDYLHSVGQPTDFTSRTKLAEQLGIQNYTGTAEENTKMLTALRGASGQGSENGAGGAGGVGTGGTESSTDSGFADSNTGNGNATAAAPDTTPKDYVGMYQGIIQSLGLTDIKGAYQKAVEEGAAVDKELTDKINDVNNDPWLTTSVRAAQISKLKQDFAPQQEVALHKQQLFDSLYKQGVQEAQFLATGEYKQQQDAALLAEKQVEAAQKLQEINPANFKSVNGGLFDIKSGRWLVPPKPATGGSGGSGGGTSGDGTDQYSTIDISRYSRAANSIVKNFIGLPQYNLTANGLPYLQRIQAADSIPGSVSDAELLDSIVKLNTGGNQVTEAQVRLITGGQSYSDALNVWKNKLGNGGVLSDSQRTQLTALATKVFDRYKSDYQPIYNQATKQLKDAGIPKAFWTIPDLNTLSSSADKQASSPIQNVDYTIQQHANEVGSTYKTREDLISALVSANPGLTRDEIAGRVYTLIGDNNKPK